MKQDLALLNEMLMVKLILGDPLDKRASPIDDVVKELVPDIASHVKEYFDSKIDKEHPTSSIINMLAPGVISATMSAMGLGRWGLLLGLLFSTMHVDVNGILSSIFGGVKSILSEHGKVSPSQINGLVSSAVQGTEEEPTTASLQDVRILKLALIDFERQAFRLSSPVKISQAGKAKVGASILAKIFGFILKIALRSAGLLLAGDAINKMIGRPNSFDHNYQPGHDEPVATLPTEQAYHSTQTKFPLKSDQPLPSSIPINNTPQNIENMLLQFAKDTYAGLDDKDAQIINDPIFQAIKEKLVWYNIKNTGYATVFIPPFWKTKKQLVDNFIDNIANEA